METRTSLLFTCSLLCLIAVFNTQAARNEEITFTAFTTGLPLSRRSPDGFGGALHLRRGRLGVWLPWRHPPNPRFSPSLEGLAPPCGRGTSTSSTQKESRRSLPPDNLSSLSPPFAKRLYNKEAPFTTLGISHHKGTSSHIETRWSHAYGTDSHIRTN